MLHGPPALSRLPLLWIFPVLLCAPLTGAAQTPCDDFGLPEGTQIVSFETSLGQLCLEMLSDDAPGTVANFLNYVNDGDYDASIVHRAAIDFVVQGGGFSQVGSALQPVPTDGQIMNEPCTVPMGSTVCSERGNERGTVAMAKLGGQPDSATSQWFINLGDNRTTLDQQGGGPGFTVFARVLGDGMDIADAINLLPRETERGYWLFPAASGALGELPVETLVPTNPIGCFDPDAATAIIDPVTGFAVPDSFTGDNLFILSRTCGTQIATGSFVENPGSMACPDADRLGLAITGPISLGVIDGDPGTQGTQRIEVSYTCEQAVVADADRTSWRADFQPRLSDELIVIESASVHTVPEASGTALALAALCTLAWQRRRD